ncbi:CCA tRNA nucleotidyltransferase [Paenibacillus tarimensis]
MLTHPLMIEAVPILSRLSEHGYEAVFVGGCVRDVMAGRAITDVDIATSAKPEEVMRLFPRTIPTGLKHGTVTIIMNGNSYELTTYRKEANYEAYRRPAQVDFITELEEDLRRRDFTINAMAMTANGALIDPFDGLKDLRNGVVRCVGNPETRFQEDALRMIRGIRFASEFGQGREYPIEQATWDAVKRHRGLLKHVAMERVGAELDKMMKGGRPDQAISLMTESGLLDCTKEPLRIPGGPQAHEGSLASITDPDLRWAAWFIIRSFDGTGSRIWLESLRYSRQRILTITSVVSFHRQWIALSAECRMDSTSVQGHWIGQVISYGRIVTQGWLEMMEQSGGLDKDDTGIAELKTIFKRMPVASIKELAVNGHDLMRELRMKPGSWVQKCLNGLLAGAASGSIPNERAALLKQARLQIEKEQG